jgi:SAM-dependent methyltransferase
MSYKVHLLGSLDPIQWSQASWLVSNTAESLDSCDQELIREVLLRYLPKGEIIVDAGCGTARWPVYLRRSGYRCLGIEINAEACRLARGLDADIPLLQGDLRHAPVRDGAAAAVISLGVVEHDEAGPEVQLRELHRILQPGGLLLIAVPYNSPWRRLIWNRLMDFVTWRRRRAGMPLGFAEYRFSRRELRRFLEATGFMPMDAHPNDLLPPLNQGLWVDFVNLARFQSEPRPVFRLPGLRGRIAAAVVRRYPWVACGEVVYVARKP